MEDKDKILEQGRFEGTVLAKLDTLEKSMSTFHEKHKEIYAHIDSIVDSIRKEIASNKLDAEAIHKDQDKRITKLEQWRWWLMGGFAIIAFVVTFLSNVLASKYL